MCFSALGDWGLIAHISLCLPGLSSSKSLLPNTLTVNLGKKWCQKGYFISIHLPYLHWNPRSWTSWWKPAMNYWKEPSTFLMISSSLQRVQHQRSAISLLNQLWPFRTGCRCGHKVPTSSPRSWYGGYHSPPMGQGNSSFNPASLPLLVQHLRLPLETLSSVMRIHTGSRCWTIFLGYRLNGAKCC